MLVKHNTLCPFQPNASQNPCPRSHLKALRQGFKVLERSQHPRTALNQSPHHPSKSPMPDAQWGQARVEGVGSVEKMSSDRPNAQYLT